MASARDLMDQLEAGLDTLLDSENFQRWLTVQARFHQYSFGNVLLIASQRPDATRVAGFHAWKKLGRSVKKGEHGIMILAPILYKRDTVAGEASADSEVGERLRMGFRVVYVFDISQTEGAPLPTLGGRLEGADAVAHSLRAGLVGLAGAEGLTVDLAAQDCSVAAGVNGYYRPRTHTIHVAADASVNQSTETLAHELGHHLLGHGHVADARSVMECQADSFAYIVCAASGLATEAKVLPYIASWAAGDTPEAKRRAIREALVPVHDAVAACLKRLHVETPMMEEVA